MVHYSKVVNGLMSYVDNEIVSKMNGSLKGWGVGIVAGLLGKRADQMFATLRNSPVLTSLGLIDGEMVDIEAVYAEALRMAQRGSATVNVPMLGAVTFTTADVESLYRYIIGG
jgi:hypothetical protein